jgi:hypothetical protein
MGPAGPRTVPYQGQGRGRRRRLARRSRRRSCSSVAAWGDRALPASERASARTRWYVFDRSTRADGRAPAGLSGWPLRVFAISRASASACAPDADVPRDGDDRRVAATQEPHCLPLSSHLALYYLRLGFPYLIRPSVIGRPLVGFHPALFGCWNQPMDRD